MRKGPPKPCHQVILTIAIVNNACWDLPLRKVGRVLDVNRDLALAGPNGS